MGVECLPYTQEVVGSMPTGTTKIQEKIIMPNRKPGVVEKHAANAVHRAEEFAADAARKLIQTEKIQAHGFIAGMPKWDANRRPLSLSEATFRLAAWTARNGGPSGASGNITTEWANYSGENFKV